MRRKEGCRGEGEREEGGGVVFLLACEHMCDIVESSAVLDVCDGETVRVLSEIGRRSPSPSFPLPPHPHLPLSFVSILWEGEEGERGRSCEEGEGGRGGSSGRQQTIYVEHP